MALVAAAKVGVPVERVETAAAGEAPVDWAAARAAGGMAAATAAGATAAATATAATMVAVPVLTAVDR
jgi:hypothetical protein